MKNTTESMPGQATLLQLQNQICDDFCRRFGRNPTVVAAAPGRVNLIGEHIDYNDGFVLPLAIDRYVLIAGAPRSPSPTQPTIRLHSDELNQTMVLDLVHPLSPREGCWTNYATGVLAGFRELGETVPEFDAVIGSTVPFGGGLSSSAALEVAVATFLEQLTGRRLPMQEKALLCQKAEHQFAGVPCGIMDQFSSVFGEPDQLMLIDCRSQEVEMVPMEGDDVSVLIINSNVRHELTGGEYAARRAQCDAALKKLGQASWRDVSMEDVEQATDQFDATELRRARHVVSEIQRTVQAADAFRRNDWVQAGRLMVGSHESLRDDFEVSCPELDLLVNLATDIGAQGGVWGSRMTGGGFGGCTVSLVDSDQLEPIQQRIASAYESATGIKPHCFSSRPARGAHVLRPGDQTD